MKPVNGNRQSSVPTPSSRSVAYTVIVTLAVPLAGSQTISVGSALAILLVPVLVSSTWPLRQARFILLATGATVVSGATLLAFNVGDATGRSIDTTAVLANYSLVIFLAVNLIVTVWCVLQIGVEAALVLYGVGSLIGYMISTEQFSDNPWKYSLSFPVCILLLVVMGRLSRSAGFACAAALIVISISFDTRNTAGALLAACTTQLILLRGRQSNSRTRSAITVAAVGLSGALVYQLFTFLALGGSLGRELEETTLNQSRNQSVIAGRVEYGATFALLREVPQGLGPGVVPSQRDVQIGKSGLADIGVGTSSSYVEESMFGNRFEVHSIAGDIWVQFGIGGVGLAAALLAVLIKTVTRCVSRSTNTRIELAVLFLAYQGLWDLLFSPLYANFRSFAFVCGVCVALTALTASSNRTVEAQEPVGV